MDPSVSLEKFIKFWPVKEDPRKVRLVEALRKAGLK